MGAAQAWKEKVELSQKGADIPLVSAYYIHLPMQETQEIWVRFLGPEDPLEEYMANPLQYSCLENSMDRGAWWAAVLGVTKNWTRLSD